MTINPLHNLLSGRSINPYQSFGSNPRTSTCSLVKHIQIHPNPQIFGGKFYQFVIVNSLSPSKSQFFLVISIFVYFSWWVSSRFASRPKDGVLPEPTPAAFRGLQQLAAAAAEVAGSQALGAAADQTFAEAAWFGGRKREKSGGISYCNIMVEYG